MKYTVTVTQEQRTENTDQPSGFAVATCEVFRQSFDELDLGKLAVALNTRPRGRPAKSKKEAT
jgi:hypothetical protein